MQKHEVTAFALISGLRRGRRGVGGLGCAVSTMSCGWSVYILPRGMVRGLTKNMEQKQTITFVFFFQQHKEILKYFL